MLRGNRLFFLFFLDVMFATAGIFLIFMMLISESNSQSSTQNQQFDILIVPEKSIAGAIPSNNWLWFDTSVIVSNTNQTDLEKYAKTLNANELVDYLGQWIAEHNKVPAILLALDTEHLNWQFIISGELQKAVKERHNPKNPFNYQLVFWPIASLEQRQQLIENWYAHQKPL